MATPREYPRPDHHDEAMIVELVNITVKSLSLVHIPLSRMGFAGFVVPPICKGFLAP
jgi:hypothetical protein